MLFIRFNRTLTHFQLVTGIKNNLQGEARAELDKLNCELKNVNVSAAKSLEEGLEETLTIHRLGLSAELSRSLGTTNCIESLMSQMGAYTDKVDRWHNSDQILRWTGTGLMDIEPRLRKFRGYRYLNVLRLKLREMVAIRTKKKMATAVPKLYSPRIPPSYRL